MDASAAVGLALGMRRGTMTLAPPGTLLWHPQKDDDFAPRLGLVCQPLRIWS
jgi:hypothetical protein